MGWHIQASLNYLVPLLKTAPARLINSELNNNVWDNISGFQATTSGSGRTDIYLSEIDGLCCTLKQVLHRVPGFTRNPLVTCIQRI